MRTTIVKHRYIRRANGGHARAAAHVRYIQYRPGETEKRKFFDVNRDEVTGYEVRCRLERQFGTVVCHKLIFSPGVQGVDLHDYTRELMIALAEKKGLDLEYYATEHHNTDHDHLHVVVMGTDKNGQTVRLDPKQDYQFLRFIGDRYIEHYHNLDRYLDQDLKVLMKRGFEHDRGDQAYERLLSALSSSRSIEELDEERRQRRAIGEEQEPDEQFSGARTDKLFRQLLEDLKSAKTWQELDGERGGAPKPETKEERRLRLIEETPAEERIEADHGKYFTKHHTLEELEAYDEDLKDGAETWLEKEQYQQLWSWIGTKNKAGDDYYEREVREQKEEKDKKCDDDLRRIHPENNEHRRRLTFRQYTYESQGRMLDTHERFQLTHARNELRKELEAMKENGEDDPERREDIAERLKWLDERASEFYPGPKNKEEKEVDKTKEDEKPRSEDKQQDERADGERINEETEGREEAPEKDRGDDKDKEDREDTGERERQDSSQDREQDQQRQDEERQLHEREEQDRREQESREREQEQDQRQAQERDEDALRQARREEDEWRRQADEEERERDEQATRDRQDREAARERQDQETLEREERETREREEREHEEQEAREREETREQEDRRHQEKKEEAERNFRLQQELDKLRQQQLEPERSGQSSSRLQEKIEQYEQEIAGQKGEHQTGDQIDRSDPLDRVQPEFDLDKNIEETWSLDERVNQDYELDSLLQDLDKEEEHERPETGQPDVNEVLFGDSAEQVPEYEKTPAEERIGEWEERAFDPELIKEQQERADSEHELADGEQKHEQTPEQQLEQQSQQHEAEQAVQIMIQRAFFEPQRDDDEHDRDEDHEDRDR
jgi:hypothetical protein